MKINSIELVGYKRLALNSIKFFHMEMDSRVQLILGTNGSGKSSLLAEMSPLPAVAANYTKEGSKKVHITYNGDDYLLTSVFSPKQEHSFLKNGTEELNPGGTVTVQRDLVWQIFGINQERHDLLTGLEKFSGMSPARRREWFTQLCETNYDYALKVFARFKERYRDTSGAVKLAKKRLVVETSKIISQESIDKIHQEMQALSAEIDMLYRARVEPEKTLQEYDRDQQHYQQESIQLSERLFSLKSVMGDKMVFTPAEYKEEIDINRHEITKIVAQSALLHDRHTELKQSYDAFVQSGALGLQEQRQRLQELQVKLKDQCSDLKLGLEFSNITDVAVMFFGFYEGLTELLSTIPENAERQYSSHVLVTAKTDLLNLKNKVDQTSRKLTGLHHQKSHMDKIKSGDTTQCPQCNHRWHPGYSEKAYAELTDSIARGEEYLDTCNKSIRQLEEKIKDNEAYGEQYKYYVWLESRSAALEPFWNYLRDEDLVAKAPRFALKQVELLKKDVETLVHIEDTKRQIANTEDLIRQAEKASQMDVQKIKSQLDEVEETLGHLAAQQHRKTTEVQTLQQELGRIEQIQDVHQQLLNYQGLLKTGLGNQVAALRYEVLSNCLRELQIELALKQNLLNDIKMQQGIIDDIQANLDQLTLEEESLKILVTALSPTDGLIAEGLLGFIRSFVGKMNFIIRSVWSYKMEVLDCQMESESATELDFKFPLTVPNNDPVPDVGKGSTAQKEVVDLAFKITAMKSLGLEDNQLFLDEFASNMDPGHKSASTVLIKNLLDQLPFSQLIMVSHDYAQYGALPNPQMCVLCPKNIVVPESYNQHVVMT